MGDYVDRSDFSLDTSCYLSRPEFRGPGGFFLLHGSGECRHANEGYGF
jgi:hypothetical protein